jgi:modulator of FtsH protease
MYVASAGAAAALAGLVFVAVSINVARILSYTGWPARGLVTVMVLLGAVVFALFGLHPDQSIESLGAELLVGGGVLTVAVLWLLLRSRPAKGEESHVSSALVLGLIGTVPYVVAGILLVAGNEAGREWLFAGIISAIISGVANAWVLLVEILR